LQGQLKDGTSCHVGPLARLALNYDKLSPVAKETAKKLGLAGGCFNPFKSIIVRGVETIFAIEESLRIIEQYKEPKDPYFELKPKAGTGYGCTEAPRGICYHRYTIDSTGTIQDAKIASPTTLNQKVVEDDLYHYVTKNINASDEELRFVCEQAVRNYDPCISCATHFLKLNVVRS
jgi:coenzyme F420-reducing hydrogenase alpha subunit